MIMCNKKKLFLDFEVLKKVKRKINSSKRKKMKRNPQYVEYGVLKEQPSAA